ncbi:MAG: MFS transporter [Rickettsiaceae bacterium]|nr:MAG: MFS transporter [Rickettsiaceae bacterium]
MLPIFLMNFLFAVSTTIGMSFLPLLVTESLGMSMVVLGIIEGGSEFASNILRLITGNLFDRTRSKRLLFVVPAALAFVSKFILLLPNTLTIVLSKMAERSSNGAFAAPRDAYIGEHSTSKGKSLGISSSVKTFGCIVGPAIVSASTIFGPLQENIVVIIVIACLVNVLAFLLSLTIDIKKKIIIAKIEEFNFVELKNTCKHLLPIFILSIIFFLGRFNDGIIMIFLRNSGFPEWYYLATISFFNSVMMIISPFLGYWIDKKRDYQILLLTITALLGFNILFFQPFNTISLLGASLGIICWGIQRAGAQITFSSLIFKNTPRKFYGSAIGIYSVLSGGSIFIASMFSGYLAQISFNYIFLSSGFFSLISLLLAVYMYRRKYI